MVSAAYTAPLGGVLDVERLAVEFDAYVQWLRQVKRPHRWLDRLRIPRLHAR